VPWDTNPVRPCAELSGIVEQGLPDVEHDGPDHDSITPRTSGAGVSHRP